MKDGNNRETEKRIDFTEYRDSIKKVKFKLIKCID